jgi:hypothetical protein
MKARVPITLDPEIHRLVKQTARKKHTTVSGLIESLLKSEAVPQTRGIDASMVGSTSLKSTVPGTDPLFDALKAKYNYRKSPAPAISPMDFPLRAENLPSPFKSST